MRPAIIATVLAIGLLLAASQATAKEIAKAIVFPGSPVEFSVVNAGNSTLFDAAIFVGKGSVELLGVLSNGNITWYKVTSLSSSKFFSYAPVLLSDDKIYIFGAQGAALQRVRLLVGTLFLRELRGETTLIELRTSGNETLNIIPIGIQPVKAQQGSHVLYLVANLVKTRPIGNATYEKEYILNGIVFLVVGLEKLVVNATLFSIRDVAVLAQRAIGDTVYVAGISAPNVSQIPLPPRNLSLVIGILHGNTLSLHYYRASECIMPIAMDIQDNTLYLECTNPERFQLSLLAVNTRTWRIEWAMTYNVSAAFVGKVQPPVVIGDKIYTPVMNGLLVVNGGTGRPLKALSVAATPTTRAPRVIGVNIWRIGGEHYVALMNALMNVEGKTVTLIPLTLIEKAKCIQAGGIALGETKIAAKPLKLLPLGTKTIHGRRFGVNMSQGPSLILTKYANISEKDEAVTYPEKCRPQGFPTPTITITATTRTITLTAIATTTPSQTTTVSINMTRPVSKEQSTTETGPIIHHSATSSVNPVSTPGNKTGASAISSTPVATSSAKAVNSHDWKRTTVAAALIALAVIGAATLLMRRK